MHVSARRGEGRIEEVVAVAVTDRLLNRSVEDGVDGQIQRHHGVDAVSRRECLHVFARGRVDGAVPSVAVTCRGFDNLRYGVVDLITSDIHRAVQPRVTDEVVVADHRCGIARIDADGGGLQLEIIVGRVDETHVELCGVVAVVVVGEVEVAGAVVTSLHSAVGAVVVIARSVAEAVDDVGASDIAPEETVGECRGAVVVVNAASVTRRRVFHQVAVGVFAAAGVDEDATAELRAVATKQTVG